MVQTMIDKRKCVCGFREMNETSTEKIWRLDFSIYWLMHTTDNTTTKYTV